MTFAAPLAAVLVSGVVLTGCDNTAPAKPASEPTSSMGAPSTTEPTGAASPSITPASGQVVTTGPMTAHVFASPDWHIVTGGSTTTAGLRVDAGSLTISFSTLKNPYTDLDESARVAEENMAIQNPRPRRVANRMVDDAESWVLDGTGNGRRMYVVGGLRSGYQWSIEFKVPADWPEAGQRIEEVLASVAWQ